MEDNKLRNGQKNNFSGAITLPSSPIQQYNISHLKTHPNQLRHLASSKNLDFNCTLGSPNFSQQSKEQLLIQNNLNDNSNVSKQFSLNNLLKTNLNLQKQNYANIINHFNSNGVQLSQPLSARTQNSNIETNEDNMPTSSQPNNYQLNQQLTSQIQIQSQNQQQQYQQQLEYQLQSPANPYQIQTLQYKQYSLQQQLQQSSIPPHQQQPQTSSSQYLLRPSQIIINKNQQSFSISGNNINVFTSSNQVQNQNLNGNTTQNYNVNHLHQMQKNSNNIANRNNNNAFGNNSYNNGTLTNSSSNFTVDGQVSNNKINKVSVNPIKLQQQQPQRSVAQDKKSLQKQQYTNGDHTENNQFFFNCFKFQNQSERNIELKQEDQSFMIVDKDTNQIYDVRQSDQLDQISSNHKQEYLDQLKKRRNYAWQNWWSLKKQNNEKLIEGAKTNNYDQIFQVLNFKNPDLQADVNHKDNLGNSALHYATKNGNLQIINILLKNDAIIDIINNFSQTPLILAAQAGFPEIVQALIQAGADINYQDKFFNTPLHYACQYEQIETIKLLLNRHSIQIKMKNQDKKMPSDLTNSLFIQSIFDDYEIRQKQNIKNAQQVKIYDTSNESVLKMFNEHENIGANISSQSTNFTNTLVTHNSSTDGNQQLQQQNSSQPQLSPQPIQKIGPEHFTIIRLIGKGSFGEVYLVEQKGVHSKKFAMKILNKSKIFGQNIVRYALTERNVLSINTQHPFIVKLRYAFQNEKQLFLIMDYCPNGDLARLIQTNGFIEESKARIYLAEILLALEHLHRSDIIYRDLKPENVVFDEDWNAMLTDFGLSKEGVSQTRLANSFCGSLAYLAPEMLKRTGHGKSVDWYHLGVLLYEMLTGQTPFFSESNNQIIQNIETSQIQYPSFISPEATSLLQQLLEKNPVRRLGSSLLDAQEIKSHPFFRSINWNQLLNKKSDFTDNYLAQKTQNHFFPYPSNNSSLNDQNNNMSNNQFNCKLPSMQNEKEYANYISGWSFINTENL